MTPPQVKGIMIPATKKPPAGARVWMAPKRTDASAVPALKFKGSGRNEAKHNAWEPIDYLVGCEGLITEYNDIYFLNISANIP